MSTDNSKVFTKENLDLSNTCQNFFDFSRIFAYLLPKICLFPLFFPLWGKNKGNFFVTPRRLLYQAVLPRFASLLS